MAEKQPIPDEVSILAYMAGIIDGEGSICIFPCYGQHHKYGKYPRYKSALTVSNTNLELIEWIAHRFGGTHRRVSRVRERGSSRWKPTYHWQTSYDRAAVIIAAIRPYLVIKARQAEIFLEFQATAKHYGRSGTPPEVQRKRQLIAAEMAALNKRGASNALDA